MLESPKSSTFAVTMARCESDGRTLVQDVLAVEEPLEIRLDFSMEGTRTQRSLSITMRTPGSDAELAAGFLLSEGIIQGPEAILEIKHCGPALPHLGHSNVLKVTLADGVRFRMESLERHFYTTSSCGVCGKSSIEALRVRSPFPPSDPLTDSLRIAAPILWSLPEKLRKAQDIFEATGALHASALFSETGELLAIREDVGRHNALDKLLGDAFLRKELPLRRAILMLSGRISFELVQKAAMAGISVVAAVGAPSSLALGLAQELGMTLVGFLRGHRFNIYSAEARILTAARREESHGQEA